MRPLFCVLAFLAAVMTASEVQSAVVFSATLNGAQANAGMGVATSATGTALLTLNDAQTRLEINMTINGIDFVDQGGTDTAANNATVFHIHRAPAGTNGPVVFGFIGPNNDTNGDLLITPFAGGANIFSAWDVSEGNGTTLTDELTNLFDGNLYFNLHTDEVPAGEIRGQISRVPEPSSLAILATLGLPAALRRRRR